MVTSVRFLRPWRWKHKSSSKSSNVKHIHVSDFYDIGHRNTDPVPKPLDMGSSIWLPRPRTSKHKSGSYDLEHGKRTNQVFTTLDIV